MARAVANFNARMTMTTTQFDKAASGVVNRTNAMQGQLSRLSSGGMQKVSRGFLELSRGVEDFSTQIGTQGFAGGIRAAGNNLSQLAFVMGGPLTGAFAGLAVAGLSALTSINKGIDETDKKLNALAATTASIGKNLDDIRSKEQFQIDIGVASGRLTEREAIGKQLENEQRRVDQFRREEREYQQIIDEANREFRARVEGEPEDPDNPDPFRRAPLRPGSVGFQNAERERDRRIRSASGQQARIREQRKNAEKRATELERRAKIADEEERRRGFREESEGIEQGRKEAFDRRQKRIQERNRKKREAANKRDRERKSIQDNIERVTERRDELQERIREGRRLNELPGGADIFTAEAQDRLSRAATGRIQVDETQARQLKELEKLNKEIRDLKDKLKKTQPINL